ncbi:MAG: cell division protein FtsQ/DivIB [Anaerolineae bacterium]
MKQRRRRSQRRLGRTYQETQRQWITGLDPLVELWKEKRSKVLSSLLLLALGWLTYYLFASEQFYIYEIKVTGNSFVPESEIYQASDLADLSIFYVNTLTTEAAVEKITGIKEVSIHTDLFDGVTIEVEERQPLLLWQTGEKRYWVDEEGIFFQPRGEAPQVIQITDTEARPVDPQNDRLHPRVLEMVLAIRPLLPQIKVWEYSQRMGLSFVNERGWHIYLGYADHLPAKMAAWQALTEHLQAKGIEVQYIDLRLPQYPYYKVLVQQ